MFSKTTSPIVFLRAYGVTMIIVLTLYVLCILLPSYWSGLYLVSSDEILKHHYNVPFYNTEPKIFPYQFACLLPLFLFMFISGIFPFISIATLIVLFLRRSMLSQSQKIFWLIMPFLIGGSFALSSKVAGAFFDWFLD